LNFQNKIVVITGASRGIGAAAARQFAAAGARVALLARGSVEINAVAKEIGDRAIAHGCDVSDGAQVQAAINSISAKLGPVDVLVNNAGVIQPISHLDAADPAEWTQAVAINLNGVFHGIHAVLPAMLANGGGTILNVSSGAANSAIEGWSAYCASKAGAAMLTGCMDKEYRGRGIRCMGLSPGTVATEMQRKIKASGINPVSKLDWSEHIPPDWAAQALIWMCSDAADEYLGQDISLREDHIRQSIGLSE